MSEHSPLPWRGDKHAFIWAPDGNREVQVAKVGNMLDRELRPFNKDRWLADRDLIVRAVNNYDALVKALERIAAIENKEFGPDWEEIDEAREIAREAIAAAAPPVEAKSEVVG